MNEKLRKILQRKKEIRAKLNAQIEGTIELTDEEIKALQGELENLNEEEEAAVDEAEKEDQRKEAEDASRKNSVGELRIVNADTQRRNNNEEKAKRGKALKQKRAITVGTSEFVAPRHTGEGVNDTFNEVSTLVDLVRITPLSGGESYQRGYVKSYGEGGKADDSTRKYKTIEPEFGYAEINKTKITAYYEEPEEIKKLTDEDYHDKIVNGMTIAEKKKMAKTILVGDGTTGEFQGIFSNPSGKEFAIDKNTDLVMNKIDETTLDEIIYSYGGEEDTVADATLILNKKDLKAFATVRTADGKKAYKIESKGNVGTIDGVPYVINSACKALSDTSTAKDDYCMAYGSLQNYEVAVFSQLEVKQSEDYKFGEGQISHKGVVFAGGNVVANNGFIRVKKGDTTTSGTEEEDDVA